MSLFGKILAVLNIVGAVAFVVLFFMDYAKREAWAYSNFTHDVVVHGLALDDKDMDDHEVPLKQDLADSTKKEWFAGGDVVSTQVEEVDHVRKAVDDRIAAAGGDATKETIELARLLTPFARHNTEREWLIGLQTNLAAPDVLNKRLHDAFTPAVDAYVSRPDDLKFPEAFQQAYAAQGPPPALALEQTFLKMLPAKPEKTFEDAAKAVGKPAAPAKPGLEDVKKAGDNGARDRALAFLKSIRDDASATLRKPSDDPATVKDTLDDVYQASVTTLHGQLKDQLDALFDEAKSGPKSPDPTKANDRLRESQRAAVAHLLFNMVEALQEDAPDKGATVAPAYTRVVTVVGLKAAAQEMNDQAQQLQRIGEELQGARDLERGEFAQAHRQLIYDLQKRAVTLHDANDLLTRKTQQLADENQTLSKRKDDVKAAEMELAAARDKTAAAMDSLRKKSDSLQKLRIDGRDVLGENLELEKQIRDLEKKH